MVSELSGLISKEMRYNGYIKELRSLSEEEIERYQQELKKYKTINDHLQEQIRQNLGA